MIWRWFALLACLWVAACNTGEVQPPWPEPKPALWEATSPAGKKGWLFGTVHALPDGLEWRTAKLNDLAANAGVLIVEIADPGDSKGQTLFASLSHTPGQPPLSARVEPDDRPALLALMDRAGADNDDFASTETWAAALMLASSVREADPANGVDRALVDNASSVRALETIASQYGLFDTLEETAQAALLAAVAQEAQADQGNAMLTAWLIGDTRHLGQIEANGMLADPTLRGPLLTQRNRAWLGTITGSIERGENPFVAVGAAHMLGDDGLPALLEQAGYGVNRIQ